MFRVFSRIHRARMRFWHLFVRGIRIVSVAFLMAIAPLLTASQFIPIAYAAGATVTSVSPNTGSTAGGTSVTINGSGFNNGQQLSNISTGSVYGNATTCGITPGGVAYCWGNNTYGQLGNGTTTSSSTPVAVTTSGVLSGKTIVNISTSGVNTCAVDSGGAAYCWGSNTSGQLGNGTTTSSSTPVAVTTSGVLSGKTVTQISAAAATNAGSSTTFAGTTCAVASGAAYCWGDNTSGQLGNGTTTSSSTPVAVTTSGVLSGKTVTQISAAIGSYTSWPTNFYIATTCAVASGAAYCWGDGTNGQLGNNGTTSSTSPVAVYTSGVLSGKTVTQISTTASSTNGNGGAGSNAALFTCAVASGAAYCWGINGSGQLGNSTSSTSATSAPVAVTTSGVLSGKTITSISTSAEDQSSSRLGFTCAIDTGGAAYCWGDNTSGQLGNSSTTSSTSPVAVTMSGALSGKTVKQIAVAGNPVSQGFVCAIANNASYCWGYNGGGQFGNGSTSTSATTSPTATTMTALPLAPPTVTFASGNAQNVSYISSTQLTATTPANPAGAVTVTATNTDGTSGSLTNAFTYVSPPGPSLTNISPTTGPTAGGTSVTVNGSNFINNSRSFSQISTSSDDAASCGVTTAGTAYCWGYNGGGQLGNNSTTNSSVPVAVSTSGVLSGKTVTQISTSMGTTCAVAGGAAYCWGSNSNGQLGNNSTANSSVPVAVSTSGVLSGKTVTQVSVGYASVCAVASGAAYCWGYNGVGELGNNSTTDSWVPVAVNTSGVLSGKTVTQVSVGSAFACAVASSGAFCWGFDGNGELGNSSTTQSNIPVAVTGGGSSVTQISAGSAMGCAVAAGVAYCWGNNVNGQLGNNSTTNSTSPVAVYTGGVLSGKVVTQVSTGGVTNNSTYSSACAIANGQAFCWGSNGNGQLGNNSTTNSSVPVAVTGAMSGQITQLNMGGSFSCALTYSNTPYCWGWGAYGQLGNNATSNSSVSVAVTTSGIALPSVTFGGTAATSLTYVSSTQLTAITPPGSGTVNVVVTNPDSQTATLTSAFTYTNPSPTITSVTPNAGPTAGGTPMTINGTNFSNDSPSFSQISTGITGSTSCGVTVAGTAYCWGDNSSGTLGNNSTTNSSVPVAVSTSGVLSGKTVTQVSVGGGFACAVASGAVYCWGFNGDGELGNGTTTNSSVPVAVTTSGVLSGQTVTQVNVGGGFACALTTSGGVYCWGYGLNGALGNSTTTDSSVPVAVTTSGVLSGKTVTQISVGAGAVCATASGAAYCWGFDGNGELGNNSTTNSSVPVAVSTSGVLSGKTVTQVSVGAGFTCALASGAPYCWGYNNSGELGNNSTTNSSVPVAVTTSGVLSGKTVTQVSAGGGNSLAYGAACVTASGAAYCWGDNSSGELGNNSTTSSSVPVAVTTSGVLSGKTVTQINMGDTTTCAVTSDNTPFCWGYNASGQVGNNTTTDTHVPASVITSGIIPMSVTFGSTAATSIIYLSPTQIQVITPAKSAGAATIVVTNPNGQTGSLTNGFTYVGTPAAPTLSSVSPNTGNITGGTNVTISGTNMTNTLNIVKIATGNDYNSTDGHTCGLSSDGRAYCWGYNLNGQLGNGTTTQSITPVAVNTSGVLSGKTVVQISAGADSTCALTADNILACWGWNSNGQLGNNSFTDSSVPVAVNMSGVLSGKTIRTLQVGLRHTCVVATDNTGYCWGEGNNGKLGNNGTAGSAVPVAVSGGLSFISIYPGINQTCATTTNYQAYCWGVNDVGQLGNNTTTDSLVPTPVTTSGVLYGKSIIQTMTTKQASCALDSTGAAYCWGVNWGGQLGNNTTTASLVPVASTMGGKVAINISGGSSDTFCITTTSGTPACWGYNPYGQQGTGNTSPVLVPTNMVTTGALSGKTITDIATTEEHSCMHASDNTLSCTGYDNGGQLGDGTTTNATQAVATLGYAMPTSITFGGSAATSLAYVNSSTLTATTPAHAAGAVNVVLTRSDSQSSTLTNGYTYATTPGQPTGLTTTPATNAVILSWSAPASNGGTAITDYKVEYSPDGGTTWYTFSHTASSATTQTVTGLTVGTTYTFRVSAINAVGTGSPSSTTTGTPTYISASAPSSLSFNVTPAAGGLLSSTSQGVTISTNAPNGYTVTLSMNGASQLLTNGSYTIGASSNTQASPGTLATNTWGYRVDGVGGFGAGPTSSETNVSSSAFSWAGVPVSGSGNLITNSSSPGTNLTTNVWYAARADTTKQAGTYTGTIVYTAVTNP